MIENKYTEQIIGCAIEVHKHLGPGLLESAYEECLFYELKMKELNVLKQQPMPLVYKGVQMECGYRLDLWIERKVIVEIKAVDTLNDIHLAQIMTYLKLTKNKIGLLINFNVMKLKEGIKRVIM